MLGASEELSMRMNRVTRGVWWIARRGTRLFMGTALLATVGHGVVLADPVATGSLTFTIGPNSTYTGSETFDDATFDVFGTPIDLGTAVGSAGFVGSYVLTSGTAGTGQNHAEASDPAVLHYDAAGAFICDASGCTSGAPGFFVLTLGNLGGTAVAGLPPGLTYTFDGQSRDTDANLDFSGTFTINAYRPSATPTSAAGCSGAGCAVTTSTSGTFAAPSGAVIPILLDVTFADVSAAGATTAVGLANVAAAPPSNVVLDAPGFPAIFFDVSTTAAVSPPVTVCFHYADADGDGIVDGSTVPATALRLLHRSGATGAFVDETVLPVDTGDEEVCAVTTGLSPFALGVSAGCGNGLVENGEECDDGAGNGRPGACCSASCALVTCSGCATLPRTDCKTPTVARASQLQIGIGTQTMHGLLTWKWTKGQGTTLADFGNPIATDDYSLCVYDDSGSAASVLFRATIPAGGTCGAKACWKGSSTGFKYIDRSGTAAGIRKASLKAGSDGKAVVSVKGKGGNLPVGALPTPLALPLIVQLQRCGQCWAATFSSALRNSETKFKARSD
jgi:hypothetical protein